MLFFMASHCVALEVRLSKHQYVVVQATQLRAKELQQLSVRRGTVAHSAQPVDSSRLPSDQWVYSEYIRHVLPPLCPTSFS
jgi:hypothetical protein